MQLRRSIASYRGYLTRLYRETEELMQNVDNEHEIQKRREATGKAFADFKEASENYCRFLTQGEEKEAMARIIEDEICVIKDSRHSIRVGCKTCHH